MLRAVIFDYGNTLIGIDPSTPSARTDYADVVARPGAERLAAHLARQGTLPAAKGAEKFIERFLEIRERNRLTAEQTGREITAGESLDEALADAQAPSLPAAALADAVRVYFSAEEERVVALEGSRETLEFLRESGTRIGLLSNATDGRYVERVATRLGMRPYFDPFFVSADLGIRKPRVEAFRAVLESWSLPAASVAMVGDSLHHDVSGANRLGLYSIHYAQFPNPFDPEHRGSVVPSAEARSHDALRALFAPLLAPRD
ncbi:MAG TPA: HAD family hydrolase [Candidatus Eisenbacteria bacterium]|nr:HAD family hydrolase [Candidatus Eisenbacteria bacterium]